MKFCLELAGYWPHHRNHIDNLIPEMMETAILADKLGFAAALIGEHHFMDFGATPDPFGLASYLAAVTEKMRLIVSVLQLPLWDVERLAGNIAQLDQLSRGRLEIGVGRGGGPFEPYRFNLPFDYESTRACYEARFDALKKLSGIGHTAVNFATTRESSNALTDELRKRNTTLTHHFSN